MYRLVRIVIIWMCYAFLLFSVAHCDLTCGSFCGTVHPLPAAVSVNIYDQTSGFFLWIDPRNKLSNGAVDISDRSSLFEIHLYNADDPSRFWIKTLAFDSATFVAANFSGYPTLVVASDETSEIIKLFESEGAGNNAQRISVTNPVSGVKMYWSIDTDDFVTVVLAPQQTSSLFVFHDTGSIIAQKPAEDSSTTIVWCSASARVVPKSTATDEEGQQFVEQDATATLLNFNIVDSSRGYCLWVNEQGVLSDNAPDAGSLSAQFNINLFNENDPNTVWISSLAYQDLMVVAASFNSNYPQLFIVSEDTPNCVKQFKFLGNLFARNISVVDPDSGTTYYWALDPSDSMTVILTDDLQSAATFVIREAEYNLEHVLIH